MTRKFVHAGKIAICGRSGAGKSTFAGLLQLSLKKYMVDAKIINVAAPLYSVQQYIYQLARGKEGASNFQDTKLLSFLGSYFREINKDSMKFHFERTLLHLEKQDLVQGFSERVIICPDARKPDFTWLQKMGFSLIYIRASTAQCQLRVRVRGDVNPSATDHELEVEYIDRNWCYEIENMGTLSALERSAEEFVEVLRGRCLQ